MDRVGLKLRPGRSVAWALLGGTRRAGVWRGKLPPSPLTARAKRRAPFREGPERDRRPTRSVAVWGAARRLDGGVHRTGEDELGDLCGGSTAGSSSREHLLHRLEVEHELVPARSLLLRRHRRRSWRLDLLDRIWLVRVGKPR